MWYNECVGTSIRIVSVLLLLAMAGGRVSTALCEIACLSAAPVSAAGVPEFAGDAATHGCHESAAQPLDDVSQAALRSVHTGCRDHASAPFALTATFVRDMLQSSASTASTFREVSSIPTGDRQLRERTPPGLSRAPIVTLRI